MMVTGHGVKARGFLALERAIAVDEFGEDMVRKKFEVASRMRGELRRYGHYGKCRTKGTIHHGDNNIHELIVLDCVGNFMIALQ